MKHGKTKLARVYAEADARRVDQARCLVAAAEALQAERAELSAWETRLDADATRQIEAEHALAVGRARLKQDQATVDAAARRLLNAVTAREAAVAAREKALNESERAAAPAEGGAE